MRGRWLFGAGAAAIFTASLVLRFLWLDRLPGINGDEAYFPVEIQRWMAGLPFTLRAPSGLFVDPLTVLSEGALLLVFQPSVWILRLPVALWSLAGIALVYALHRRLHRSSKEALLVAVTCAALPLALAYARCGWVPSLLPLATALVWYPVQLAAEGRGSRANNILLAVGALLCLSIHMTSGVFLLAAALAFLWVRRAEITARIATRLGVRPRAWHFLAGLAAILLVTGVAFAVACAAANLSLEILGRVATRTIAYLGHPLDSLGYVALFGRFLSGASAYRFFAGVECPLYLEVESLALCALLVLCVARMCRSRSAADRFTGAFWIVVPFLLLATRGFLSIDFVGQDRYVLWMLVACPSVIVRGLDFSPRGSLATRAAPIFALCAILSIQFWQLYFVPLRAMSHMPPRELHRTFWTGPREPKLVAARMIADETRAEGDGARTRVLAEDYWIQYPVQFLLGTRWTVQVQMQQAGLVSPAAWFAIGYSESEWSVNLRSLLNAAHVPFDEVEIFDGAGPHILTLFRVRARH